MPGGNGYYAPNNYWNNQQQQQSGHPHNNPHNIPPSYPPQLPINGGMQHHPNSSNPMFPPLSTFPPLSNFDPGNNKGGGWNNGGGYPGGHGGGYNDGGGHSHPQSGDGPRGGGRGGHHHHPRHFNNAVPSPPNITPDCKCGIGSLVWLSSKAGLIKSEGEGSGGLGSVSFQLKDFCDQAVLDLTSVLRPGFTLQFWAAQQGSDTGYVATFVRPLPEMDVSVPNIAANLEAPPGVETGPPQLPKDPYNMDLEKKAIPMLLEIFQRQGVTYCQLGSFHMQISNCGDEELYRYVGTSSLKRRQFLERRTHIFHISHNDTVTLQPAPLYTTLCRLAEYLLKHGGACLLQELFDHFNDAPEIPLEARELIGDGKNAFLRFLETHPWIFAIFPTRVFVSVRRQLISFDYATYMHEQNFGDQEPGYNEGPTGNFRKPSSPNQEDIIPPHHPPPIRPGVQPFGSSDLLDQSTGAGSGGGVGGKGWGNGPPPPGAVVRGGVNGGSVPPGGIRSPYDHPAGVGVDNGGGPPGPGNVFGFGPGGSGSVSNANSSGNATPTTPLNQPNVRSWFSQPTSSANNANNGGPSQQQPPAPNNLPGGASGNSQLLSGGRIKRFHDVQSQTDTPKTLIELVNSIGVDSKDLLRMLRPIMNDMQQQQRQQSTSNANETPSDSENETASGGSNGGGEVVGGKKEDGSSRSDGSVGSSSQNHFNQESETGALTGFNGLGSGGDGNNYDPLGSDNILGQQLLKQLNLS